MPAAGTEFIIQPNSACNDGSWRWVFASLTILAFAVAIRFAALGFWMILPFTVLEISALALALWIVRAQSATGEKVLIGDEVVEIRRFASRAKGREKSWRFPLGWTRLRVSRPAHRWYPRRLALGYAGEWVEIGRCLRDDERRSLAAALRRALNGFPPQPPPAPAPE